MIHRRDRAFKAWKNTKNSKYEQKFKELQRQCQSKIRKACSDYTNGIFNLDDGPDDKTTAMKRFWSYIKAKRKDSSSVAPLRDNGILVSDVYGKAEILNKQYKSVFTDEDKSNIPTKEPENIQPAPDITVEPKCVENLLKGLKPDKASGPDMISRRVLKELAEVLSVPLAKVFQTSIK